MRKWWHVKMLGHWLVIEAELETENDRWIARVCSCGKTWNVTSKEKSNGTEAS